MGARQHSCIGSLCDHQPRITDEEAEQWSDSVAWLKCEGAETGTQGSWLQNPCSYPRSLPVQEVWEWDWGWGSPSWAFHPALRDLMVLSSILQPSIFVTPIPPLHPQTNQAFHPTWSSPILPAPISASHPAVSDPNFSLFPGPALAYPTSFSPALPLPLQFGSPGHGGPACQGRGRWGLSIREPGAGAGGSLWVHRACLLSGIAGWHSVG